ncbi:DBH-like monooxygenase protein 2 isoform X2 [Artemia franciscana]|uniref:DOMON domain-containing protein n=1 Tax=Artemia franciscana TaxID=6661 RepID=A0AA88HY24_ARTSF|nr:hypothetical protein QYM36_011079 [Artemia franciscana]
MPKRPNSRFSMSDTKFKNAIVSALREILDPNATFILRWTPDFEEKKVDFEFEAQAIGWIGIIFVSPSSASSFADTVIAGVFDDGSTYIQDRYTDVSIPEPDTPQPLDIQQDWPLVYAEEANGKTIVRTSRAFDTNDPQDNPIIQDETILFSWAYDDEDLVDGEPLYHGEDGRGTVLLNLLYPEKTL